MSDSVKLDKIISDLGCEKYGTSFKSLIIMFVIVLVVLSTAFTNYVVGSFRNAVSNREITSFGTMIQALCIVIIYAITSCLESYNVL